MLSNFIEGFVVFVLSSGHDDNVAIDGIFLCFQILWFECVCVSQRCQF